MSCRRSLGLLLLVCVWGMFTAQAIAQSPRTIRVAGTATIEASPNYIVLRGSISQGGDTAKEAIEKFNEEKEKIAKTLEGEKPPRVTIEFAGEKLTPQMVMGDEVGAVGVFVPAAAAGPASKFSLTEDVVMRMKLENDMQRTGIVKELAGFIDTAAKAGLQFGGTNNNIYAQLGLGSSAGAVQFELDKAGIAELRTKTYAAAFADARARAEALAKLAGGRLGKVVSVDEQISMTEDDAREALEYGVYARLLGQTTGGGGIDRNGRIEFQQELKITFELVD